MRSRYTSQTANLSHVKLYRSLQSRTVNIYCCCCCCYCASTRTFTAQFQLSLTSLAQIRSRNCSRHHTRFYAVLLWVADFLLFFKDPTQPCTLYFTALSAGLENTNGYTKRDRGETNCEARDKLWGERQTVRGETNCEGRDKLWGERQTERVKYRRHSSSCNTSDTFMHMRCRFFRIYKWTKNHIDDKLWITTIDFLYLFTY